MATRMQGAGRLAVLAATAMLGAPLAAHGPHDVAQVVAVSPDFPSDGTLFAAVQLTDHPFFARSTDGGLTWQVAGLPMVSDGIVALAFSPAWAADGTAFAATIRGGVFVTHDRGSTWAPASSGLADPDVRALALSPAYATNGTLLAATAAGLFRSTDGAASWTPVTAGLTETSLTAVAFAPGSAVAFVAGAVLHRSDDGGASFTALAGLTDQAVRLAVSPAFATDAALAVCFGRYGGSVALSTDGGASFTSWGTGLVDDRVNAVVFAPDGTAFAASYEGFHRAAALAGPWLPVTQGFEPPTIQTVNHYLDVAASPGFAADRTLFVASFEGMFVSTDGGTRVQQQDLYSERVHKRFEFSPDFARDGRVFFGNYGNAVLAWRAPTVGAGAGGGPAGGALAGRPTGAASSVPGGPTTPLAAPPLAGPGWEPRAQGISSLFCTMLAVSPTFATDRTLMYGFAGAWRSTDGGHAWSAMSLPPGVNVLRDVGYSPAFASDGRAFLTSSNEGQSRTLDGGDSWQLMDVAGSTTLNAQEVAVSPAFPSDGTVFLGCSDEGVWRSTDFGNSWAQTISGLAALDVRALEISPHFASDRMLLAGTIGDGVFLTVDGGDSWAAANAGLPAGVPLIVESFAFSPGFATDHTVFVLLLDDGLFRSTDGGLAWQPVGTGLPWSAPRRVRLSPRFTVDGTVIVTTHAGVWRSSDGGAAFSRLDGYVRADDVHPTVFRSGGWTFAAQPGANGLGVSTGNVAGRWRELGFSGRSITWHAAPGPASGLAEVLLDGTPVASVDLYAPTAEAPGPAFHAAFPTSGWHVIRVRVTGDANPASTGTAVRTDGFSYTY